MQLDNIQLKLKRVNVQGISLSYEGAVYAQRKHPEMLAYVRSQEKLGEVPYEGDPSLKKKLYRLPNGMIASVPPYSIVLYRSWEDYQNYEKAVKLGEGKNEIEQYKKQLDTRDPRPRIVNTQAGEEVHYWQYTNLPDVSLLKPLVKSGFEKSWLDSEGFYWLNWMQAKHYMRFDTAAHLEAWTDYIMLSGPRQWNGRNPYQKHILEKRSEIQAKLAELLQLKTPALEVSINGSRQLHQAMHQHVFSDEFINAMFLPLTLYLGDLYIQLKKGSWIIKYDDSIDNWIPLIQKENGRIFDIGTNVYYDLLSNEEETDYFPPLIEVFRRAV